jgi:hypothetical protein
VIRSPSAEYDLDLDLCRFVGDTRSALTHLTLNHVDGVSWSSIRATILANALPLVELRLASINVCTSDSFPPPVGPAPPRSILEDPDYVVANPDAVNSSADDSFHTFH